MNFPQIDVPEYNKEPSLSLPRALGLHDRTNSVSTDASGMESLIGNVLDDIEAFELEQEELGIEPETTKLKEEVLQNLQSLETSYDHETEDITKQNTQSTKSKSPKKSSPKHKISKSTSIDDHTHDHTPTLPLSTTKPATETKVAFITHFKNTQPEVTVQPLSQNTYTHTQFNYPVNNGNSQPQPQQYKLFSPNPFYPGQSLPILVQVAPNTNNNMNQPQPHTQTSAPMPSHHGAAASMSAVGTVGGVQNLSHSSSHPTVMHHGYAHSHSVNVPSHLQHTQSTASVFYHGPSSKVGYKGPPPKVANTINTSSPKRIGKDPILKLQAILKDMDDDNDGELDKEEFCEALNEVDKDLNDNELTLIFNALSNKDSNELNIKSFIKHIRTSQSKSKLNMTTPTPRTVFRGAFPDVFEAPQENDGRELWGGSHMTSMHKLEQQLQEEAEQEGVIDYPEFQAAIDNMGIDFTKSQLKKLFAHFLGEQDAFDHKMGIHHPPHGNDYNYEVRLGFIIDLLKTKVDNHEHLKPKQIIKLAFMDLLLNENQLNRRSSFLKRHKSTRRHVLPINTIHHHESDEKVYHIKDDNDNSHDQDTEIMHNKDVKGNESDDSFEENPDFDNEISEMNGYKNMNEEPGPPTLSSHGGGSYTKGDRQLMRMGSTAHWNDREVEMAQHEMEDAIKMLEEQNSGLSQISSISPKSLNMIAGGHNSPHQGMYHAHSGHPGHGSPKKNRTYGYYK